jgi:hypothetical protein
VDELHEIADAELIGVEEVEEDFESSVVGEGFEKLGERGHDGSRL